MLKLSRTDTFAATVAVSLPTDDPAVRNEGSFTANFRRLDKRAVDDLLARLKAGDATDDDVLDAALVSVSGIGTADGEPLASDDAIKQVRADFALAAATALAFFQSVGGAAEKNASKSRGR